MRRLLGSWRSPSDNRSWQSWAITSAASPCWDPCPDTMEIPKETDSKGLGTVGGTRAYQATDGGGNLEGHTPPLLFSWALVLPIPAAGQGSGRNWVRVPRTEEVQASFPFRREAQVCAHGESKGSPAGRQVGAWAGGWGRKDRKSVV